MVDKQLADLKKRLNELSQKSPKKENIPKKKEVPKPAPMQVQAPVPIPAPVPAPIPSPVLAGVDLNGEEMELLKKQIERMEQKQVEKEKEVPQEIEEEEPSEEDVQKIQQLQLEIERLQNTGIYRAEMLYQYVGLNTNLNRIATALEKLEGADAQK